MPTRNEDYNNAAPRNDQDRLAYEGGRGWSDFPSSSNTFSHPPEPENDPNALDNHLTYEANQDRQAGYTTNNNQSSQLGGASAAYPNYGNLDGYGVGSSNDPSGSGNFNYQHVGNQINQINQAYDQAGDSQNRPTPKTLNWGIYTPDWLLGYNYRKEGKDVFLELKPEYPETPKWIPKVYLDQPRYEPNDPNSSCLGDYSLTCFIE